MNLECSQQLMLRSSADPAPGTWRLSLRGAQPTWRCSRARLRGPGPTERSGSCPTVGMLQPHGRMEPSAVHVVRHQPPAPCGSWEEQGLLRDFKNKQQGRSSPNGAVVGNARCLRVTEAPHAPVGSPRSIPGTRYF